MTKTFTIPLVNDLAGGDVHLMQIKLQADGTYLIVGFVDPAVPDVKTMSVSGLQLTTAGVNDSSDKRFVTDAELGILSGKSTDAWTIAGALVITKVGSLAMGTLSSANDTSGVALSAAKPKAAGINADTGGAALVTGTFARALSSRFLLGTAISSGADISTAGIEGLLKSIVSVNVGGNQAGVVGHYESAGTVTLTGSSNVVKSGVSAFMDLAAGATIPVGTVISAFGVHPANFGTLNGRSAVVHVTTPFAGVWQALFDTQGLNGIAAAAAGVTQSKHGVIVVDGVTYTFPLYRA